MSTTADMLAAIEFAEEKSGRKFVEASRGVGPAVAAAFAAKGVIGRAVPQGDILGFAPPFCLTRDEADLIAGVRESEVH